MSCPQNRNSESALNEAGFFSIFPILGKLLWQYGRRLLSVDTLVALEKNQGGGSGERSLEDELFEQSLQRNKHHYHIGPDELDHRRVTAHRPSDLTSPVLYVKKGGDDDGDR